MQCKEHHSFAEYLKTAGLRHTKAREKILKTLHDNGRLSADELTKRMDGTIDRVSAYRALSAFMSAGLVVPVLDPKGAVKYELADHHSHYLTCSNCGIKEALAGCEFESIQNKALKTSKHFSAIQSHAVEFFGTCNACAKAI